ncbi:GatB/YqeY domain-containing protein [candidate division KSB1 bacterium]|nr:MAG: GatB/YqeY domain-containing protein [candidate division KSB1 bacterium]
MNLESKIQEDMKAALKAGDRETLQTLRGLLAQIKDERIKKRPNELSEEDVLAVIQRAVKRRKESIELYKQGNRQDLVDKEQKEMEILQKYLPQQLSRDEIIAIVNQVIDQVGATSVKDLGKVMGPVMKQVKGRADGKEVQQIVRERLS